MNSGRRASLYFNRLETNASQQFFCILQGWKKAFRGTDTILISGLAVVDTVVKRQHSSVPVAFLWQDLISCPVRHLRVVGNGIKRTRHFFTNKRYKPK